MKNIIYRVGVMVFVVLLWLGVTYLVMVESVARKFEEVCG